MQDLVVLWCGDDHIQRHESVLCGMQVWVDGEHVLVGTKCNRLLCLNTRTQRQLTIPLPERPGRPAVLEAVSTPYKHCGMHCIAVSPDGQRIAAGGHDPSDCQIFDVSEAINSGHMPNFAAGQTLMVQTSSGTMRESCVVPPFSVGAAAA